MAVDVTEGVAVGVVVGSGVVAGSVGSGVVARVGDGGGESPPQATSATKRVARTRKRATTAFTPEGYRSES